MKIRRACIVVTTSLLAACGPGQTPGSSRGPVTARIGKFEPMPTENKTAVLSAPPRWCGETETPDPLLQDAIAMASPAPDNSHGMAGNKLIHKIRLQGVTAPANNSAGEPGSQKAQTGSPGPQKSQKAQSNKTKRRR